MKVRSKTKRRLQVGGVVTLSVSALTIAGLAYTGTLNPEPPPTSDRVAEYLARPPAQVRELPFMAVVGDSFSLEKPEYWHQRTARCINHQVLVSAVGGSGFAQEGKNKQTFDFAERRAAVAAVKPDLIIFATAFNDAAYTLWQPEFVRTRIAETIDNYRAENPSAKLVIMGPFWAIDPLPQMITTNRDIMAEVALERGVTYVNSSTWVREPADLATNDGQHPTASGHELIANNLLAELEDAGLYTPNEACEI